MGGRGKRNRNQRKRHRRFHQLSGERALRVCTFYLLVFHLPVDETLLPAFEILSVGLLGADVFNLDLYSPREMVLSLQFPGQQNWQH